jgi:basic membrane lipoprotein Med (substrate-binding protein (PBP1-ABC) superfamily)
MKKTKIAPAALLLTILATAALVVTSAGSAKRSDVFKVAWIYVGPHNDAGWSQAHDAGRLYVQKALGS